MTATSLIDTNVLLYAASNAPPDQPKRAVARQLLKEPGIAFSVQVLQEFYAAAVTKQRLQMTHQEAVAVLQSLAAFPVWPLTRELVLESIDAKERFQISYWDAAILTAAKQMGCRIVYSEDFDPARDYQGLRVINPFRTTQPSPTPPA